MENSNTGNNSTCTAMLPHETGAFQQQLKGNPFTDLTANGIELRERIIRYLHSPNKNGNTITGCFNVSGRKCTAGAKSYEELILLIIRKEKNRNRSNEVSRTYNEQSDSECWFSYHPEYTFNNCNITFR